MKKTMNNNRVSLQSGKGIGGIFRFLSNILMPVLKKVAPVIKTYVNLPQYNKD